MGIEIKTGGHAGILEYNGEYFYHHQLVHRIRDHLLTYRHSNLERNTALNAKTNTLKIIWEDHRPPYEIYWADYINAGPNDFQDLFFADYEEFYHIPDFQRDQYIVEALYLWEQIFHEKDSAIWTTREFILAANDLYRNLLQLKKKYV